MYNRGQAAADREALRQVEAIRKGDDEERLRLRLLYHQASELLGQRWESFADDETIERAAGMMVQYRIGVSNLIHKTA